MGIDNIKLINRISEMKEIKKTLVGINAYDMTLQDLEIFWNKAQKEIETKLRSIVFDCGMFSSEKIQKIQEEFNL